MKKLTAIILCAVFTLSLCGCKSGHQKQSSHLSFDETVETSSVADLQGKSTTSDVLQNNSSTKSQKTKSKASSKAQDTQSGSSSVQQNTQSNTNENNKILAIIKNFTQTEYVKLQAPNISNKTLTLNILGKDQKFNYVKTRKHNTASYDINDLLVYTNGDVDVEIESKTKQVISIDFNNNNSDRTNGNTEVSAQTLLRKAQQFAGQYCDLSKYNECEVSQYRSQYSVIFRKTINGLTTSQCIVVDINKDLSIASFERAPDMFDAYDLSKITVTEQDIIQLLYDKNKDNENFNCKIHNIVLMVKDSKLQAEVCYWELDEQGNYIMECAIAVDYIVIK